VNEIFLGAALDLASKAKIPMNALDDVTNQH